MNIANLHNHSTWSDGSLSIEALMQAAIAHDIAALGITDHLLTHKTRSISYEALPEYLEACRVAARSALGGRVKIFAGIEIDGSDLAATGRRLPLELLNQLDFILFEAVNDRAGRGLPLASFLDLRKSLSTPVGLAHNDLMANFPQHSPLQLVELWAREQVFIELNPTYARFGENQPYYHHARSFFEAAAGLKTRFSLGSDTHLAASEVMLVTQPLEFLQALGLESQIITDLPER